MTWHVLDINPEPWRVGPVGVSRGGGKIKAYVGRDEQLAAYQAAIKEQLESEEKISGPVALEFYFWRNQASYETQKGSRHQKHQADATNMQKATEDALQGVLIDNDRDVVSVKSYIVEQGPEVTGRIVIQCLPAQPFDPDQIPSSIWNKIDEVTQLPFENDEYVSKGELERLF